VERLPLLDRECALIALLEAATAGGCSAEHLIELPAQLLGDLVMLIGDIPALGGVGV
jgi:hypothetical protein